jgi:hypothetical protein
MKKKVLFLAYNFPPIGGAGTQRSLKFVKYLPFNGFQPMILAGLKGGDDRWAPVDEELVDEIDDFTVVRRVNLHAKQFSGRIQRIVRELLHMRAQFGERWLNGIRTAGRQLCREQKPDLIFATMSPFESATGASELSAAFGIPWVADLRDPWALDEWQIHQTRWHRMLKRREMERSLRSASLIIMNTPEAAARCREAFPALTGIPIIHLTNGYDAEDFSAELSPSGREAFTIVHAGALHTSGGLKQMRHDAINRLLGRMQHGVKLLPRSHFYLLQALEKWLREDPSVSGKLRLEFVGVPTAEDQALVRASPAAAFTTFTGYLNHSESVARIRGANLLFLPMHSLPPGRRATIVPGKTYEYIASGRHILAAVPDGDAKDFLIQSGNATICRPDDVNAMLRGLKERYSAWCRNESLQSLDPAFCNRFERRNLTAQLAEHLSAVLK